jgi:hypothetical protein
LSLLNADNHSCANNNNNTSNTNSTTNNINNNHSNNHNFNNLINHHHSDLNTKYETLTNGQRVIIIESNGDNNHHHLHHSSHHNNNYGHISVDSQFHSENLFDSTNLSTAAVKKGSSLLNSGFSSHIIQNYSILAQEISLPMENQSKSTSSPSSSNIPVNNDLNSTASNLPNDFKHSPKILDEYSHHHHHSHHHLHHSLDNNSLSLENSENELSQDLVPSSSCCNLDDGNLTLNGNRSDGNKSIGSRLGIGKSRKESQKATCQFCGRAMLKKNIPTHIRRAHTPKEELICLNEEQNIFTLHHLKPGQRRKRSARAYDYSLMTATVNIDDDPTEGIENKFITEGEEILSTDLLQLADRIKYGVSQIPIGTLTKLIEILTKIEMNTQDEISANAKSIRNLIYYYLTSGEEFKYKIKQVSENITEKKKQVYSLRADLKEIMTRKAQLERKIQPLVCELQRLEDQHGNLIESILKENDMLQFEILPNDCSTQTHI